MKNVFKFSLLVLSMFLSVSGLRAEDLDVKISNGQVLSIDLQNVDEGTVLVFQDKNGVTLFKDSLLAGQTYHKSFNLEVIPNGDYYLNLEKEDHILITAVTKTGKGLEMIDGAGKVIFKPLFKVEENKVQVFLTNPEERTAQVYIFDKNGVLVGSVNNKDFVVRKTFDFSNVPAGEYTFKVKCGNRDFIKILTVG